MTAPPAPGTAALERLATALDSREFATSLVAGDGRRPCLTVASRHTGAAEDIYADRARFWWGWAYPMCRPCWAAVREIAERHRPGLVICDTTAPPPVTAGPQGAEGARPGR